MRFEVTGSFRMGRVEGEFSKQVDAVSENHAVETVCSLLGSEHRVSRGQIVVESVEPL
ncbi:MAG: 50S ribosomal protein L18Ae [Methanonatronarchaeales archaeon]|nr:50S ribosomal protein L18Ae [Methanonatronarchaeales archaeon]